MKWNAYWRLMRFNKPAGLLLLWFPTIWALWSSNKGLPPLHLILLFTIGTGCTRAAGCIINDIADREVDKHVARAQFRPLTTNELSLTSAWSLLFILLVCSFFTVIQLPKNCFYIALIAIAITGLYPFCKRFFYAPQLVLGLAFSIGIPMAYVASVKPFDQSFYLLFLINFIWIISYDTMYAMADKEDDIRIGVQSTALFFASYDRLIVALLQVLIQFLWFYWALLIHAYSIFYIFWFLAGCVFIYQQKLISKRKPQDCLKAFTVSIYYGTLMSFAVGCGFLI